METALTPAEEFHKSDLAELIKRLSEDASNRSRVQELVEKIPAERRRIFLTAPTSDNEPILHAVMTAYHQLCQTGSDPDIMAHAKIRMKELVNYLIDAGADPLAKNSTGQTPQQWLRSVLGDGDEEDKYMFYALEQGEKREQKRSYQNTPFEYFVTHPVDTHMLAEAENAEGARLETRVAITDVRAGSEGAKRIR